jgi:hypothetical protein
MEDLRFIGVLCRVSGHCPLAVSLAEVLKSYRVRTNNSVKEKIIFMNIVGLRTKCIGDDARFRLAGAPILKHGRGSGGDSSLGWVEACQRFCTGMITRPYITRWTDQAQRLHSTNGSASRIRLAGAKLHGESTSCCWRAVKVSLRSIVIAAMQVGMYSSSQRAWPPRIKIRSYATPAGRGIPPGRVERPTEGLGIGPGSVGWCRVVMP